MNVIATSIPGVMLVEPRVNCDARGFAHGFLVRSDSADFFYKCDAPYSAADELVLRWNALGIDWGCDDPQLSARDRNGSTLAELAERLPRYEAA